MHFYDSNIDILELVKSTTKRRSAGLDTFQNKARQSQQHDYIYAHSVELYHSTVDDKISVTVPFSSNHESATCNKIISYQLSLKSFKLIFMAD
jgi:hypothetical protein